MSYNVNPVIIYWMDSNNNRKPVGTLLKGERNTQWHQSYLGHKFELVDKDTGALLKGFTVQYDEIVSVGNYASRTKTMDVRSKVLSTFNNEWQRANRVTRTFTEYGFAVGKLPKDIWGSVSSYYYNNRNNKVLEEWDSKGLFVNWWEADCFFIPIPLEKKQYWQGRLKTLVEAWAGVELDTTDMYGLRRYETGAKLLTHVDREATHAASLIINVAQSGMVPGKPWPVEIYDFAGRLHEIDMEEGDIVYYESARCLHGRMQPLYGDYYVNLFAHYRPVGDPQWFTRTNPDDAPMQALDIGKCAKNADSSSVSCSKESPPYLSPKMLTLQGPTELYNHWLQFQGLDVHKHKDKRGASHSGDEL